MFLYEMVSETGDHATLKRGDHVWFEWTPTAIRVSVFPAGQWKNYQFVCPSGHDSKLYVTVKVPGEKFDEFCKPIMVFLSYMAGGLGFKRVKRDNQSETVRLYEIV